MNEIKKTCFDIVHDLQNCDYVFNDEIAHHCLRLSSDDIEYVIKNVYCHLELKAESVLNDKLVSYRFKDIQEEIKNTLGALNDLKDIKKIIKNKENACKHENYQEYMEDENGEMIYSCQACEGTFYRFDED